MTASTVPAATVAVTHGGVRYAVERTPGHEPDTVVERWPGRGVVGSTRAWRGTGWAAGVTWWAAVNPTSADFAATASVEGLASRRAAVAWLLARAGAR